MNRANFPDQVRARSGRPEYVGCYLTFVEVNFRLTRCLPRPRLLRKLISSGRVAEKIVIDFQILYLIVHKLSELEARDTDWVGCSENNIGNLLDPCYYPYYKAKETNSYVVILRRHNDMIYNNMPILRNAPMTTSCSDIVRPPSFNHV